MVFTFKGQLDAFSEKQFKTFVTNNLKNDQSYSNQDNKDDWYSADNDW